MKKALIILVTVLMMCTSGLAQPDMSLIMNGSFEKDSRVIPDLRVETPSYWFDANIPLVKFDGWVSTDFATHGNYNLTLSTNTEQVTVGDIATISKQVFLEGDVEKIIFDLQLSSGWLLFYPWDPNLRTVLLKIDGETIWNSDDLEINEDGEYIGCVEIDSGNFQQYLDENWHTLLLAMRVNESGLPDIEYYADWDFIRFDKYCGGFGYLPGDLSQDCYVDFADFALLAGQWLGVPAAAKYDLFEDDIVDEHDLMYLAEDWLFNTDSFNWGKSDNVEMELLDGDIDFSGEINYGDISILGENWLSTDADSIADINGDGVIDFKDFAIIAEQWQLRDWIYYLD